MAFSCANPRCNKEYNNKRSLHLHYQQSPLCNPSSQSFPVGNAGPFGDFDLSDMDLSLTSLCERSNNVRESLMDISLAVPVVAAAASVVTVASVLSVAVASVASAVVVALELVEVAVVLAAAVAEV